MFKWMKLTDNDKIFVLLKNPRLKINFVTKFSDFNGVRIKFQDFHEFVKGTHTLIQLS